MKIFFLNIILFFSIGIAAQIPSYKHFETSNGLPSNEVYSIVQSKQGYLWLGTDAGLVRYDGNSFQVFTCKQSRGNAINSLAEDKFGRIWCANFSGQVFYLNDDTMKVFAPFEKRYKTSYAEICIDKNNNLYITNQDNYLFKYNLNTLQETLLLNTSFKASPFVTSNDNILFTSLDEGAVAKLKTNNSYSKIQQKNSNTTAKLHFYNRVIFSNSFLNKKTLAFQRFNIMNPEAKLFNYINDTLYEHPISSLLQKNNSYAVTVFDDDNNNLFVGTNEGLFWFTYSNNVWHLKSKFLNGISITTITKDIEGDYWIGTSKNGVYKLANIDINEFDFTHLNLKSVGVNHIVSDNNNSLVGVSLIGEILKINTDNLASEKLLTPEQRDAQTLGYNYLTKNFWVTQNNTYKINIATNNVATTSIFFTNVKDLYFRSDGAIFYQNSFSPEICVDKKNETLKQKILAEFTIINDTIYTSADKQFRRFTLSYQRSKGLWYQEKQKILWVGFIDGVGYYENRKLIKLFDNITNEPIIINQFAETKNGNLIIATPTKGIYIINNKKIVAHYTTANKLASNNIKAIKLDNNILWMIAGSTVQSFNISNEEILLTVDEQDGLHSNELYDIEILKDNIYIASSKGIQYFPKKIQTKNNIAPISIIKKIVADDSVYKNFSNVTLPYNTKNIAIHLQGISLKSNGNFTYQYRLLPSDSNWISVSSKENIVRYSSLSYGKYFFESRVLNEDGIISKHNATLAFVVNKPWWLQWWFITLIFCVVILCSYFFYINRLKKNQQKLKEDLAKSRLEEELRKSQLASLKSQMNPHFMFNALNSIQEFIILNDKEQANFYLGKFADLMRMILDMSNKEEVMLADEIKMLHLYLELESLRFEDKFSYEIIVKNEINEATIYIPPMLVQPYVENAVKHGLLHKKGTKKVSIYFELVNSKNLICKVTDNGIGRKRSNEINAIRQKRHTSFATGATQTRLELLNAKRINTIAVEYTDGYDKNNNATGTEVCIQMPI